MRSERAPTGAHPNLFANPYCGNRMRLLGARSTRLPPRSRRRSLVKTAGYRLLMVVVTVLVALLVTGNLTQALNIGIVANAVKTGTYYGYERLWARID